MVVVSWNSVKNAVPYAPQIDDVEQKNETMAAKAILICCPNSHRFQERTLTLDQHIKVGRSVARAKPTSTNAIFDCKVLSRHHALLWYDDGKFYLQDTKSSNGTFVNNTKLSVNNEEYTEIHSGDIVQFGVDVVENNHKVTHGCIIATVKLFLPDGREAIAPTTEEEKSRMYNYVPLDDLYKLNQIIQEANQREQCLESKLSALQDIVDETKRSAEESWQAYVGEERLLSRLSALETQLQQTRTNWSEDKLKEEIARLRENNEKYQEAAKEALEKVHNEKHEAIVLAVEQERAKISAKQDALLARELLENAQLEIQEISQKLTEVQTKADEDKQEHEKQVQELEERIQKKDAHLAELGTKLYELNLELSKKQLFGTQNQRPELIFENDLKSKEDILAENEIFSESNLNNSNSNGIEANHIKLTVAPVEENCEKEKVEDNESESATKDDAEGDRENHVDDGKRVSFNIPEDRGIHLEESRNGSDNTPAPDKDAELDNSDDFDYEGVDSKTLKYQYQSAQKEQMELRRQIEFYETTVNVKESTIRKLNQYLDEERERSSSRLAECTDLEQKLAALDDKWKECCEHNERLQDEILKLNSDIRHYKESIEHEQLNNRQAVKELGSNYSQEKETDVEEKEVDLQDKEENKIECINEEKHGIDELSGSAFETSFISNASVVSNEQLMNIEEELVLLKERYAQNCEEKVKLQRDLLKLRVQYDMVCDNMYNKYFWYVGPLVIIVLYLLIREWIS